MPTAESRRMLSELTLSRQPENVQGAVFGRREGTTFGGGRDRVEACWLTQKSADTIPAGVFEEALDEPRQALFRRRAQVGRPDDEHGAADDEVAWDGAPDAAVGAVVAVVAHHEVGVRRNLV